MSRPISLAFALLPCLAACAQGGFGPDAGPGILLDATVVMRDAGVRPPRMDATVTFPDAEPVGLDGEVEDPDACVVSLEQCNGVDDNCDGMVDEDPDSTLCTFDNAEGVCSGGTCMIGDCLDGFEDCDGDATNGCEGDFATTATCGSCTNSCDAGERCVAGTCEATTCADGTIDCDGDASNGCEVDHNDAVNSCETAMNLGSACADFACGFPFCDTSTFVLDATQTGTGSMWFRMGAEECSTCASDIGEAIRLRVPAGADFDYCVYTSCSASPVFCETKGTGVDEFNILRRGERSGIDDGFDYWIEVYYWNGASCEPWTLEVFGTDCT